MNTKPWVAFSLAVVITHNWYGILAPFDFLTKGTQFGTYLELATPFAVVGSAAWAALSKSASTKTKVLFAIAAILYIEGHGIHLAANSINNAHPIAEAGVRTHFWDEEFGHTYQYLGWWLLTLLVASAGKKLARPDPIRIVLALLYGFTLFTNGVEGGVVPLLVAFLVVAYALNVRKRSGYQVDLLVSLSVCTTLLLIFGVWQGGYPEFSELGWI